MCNVGVSFYIHKRSRDIVISVPLVPGIGRSVLDTSHIVWTLKDQCMHLVHDTELVNMCKVVDDRTVHLGEHYFGINFMFHLWFQVSLPLNLKYRIGVGQFLEGKILISDKS